MVDRIACSNFPAKFVASLTLEGASNEKTRNFSRTCKFKVISDPKRVSIRCRRDAVAADLECTYARERLQKTFGGAKG
jgi:hypothetical protein